MIYQDGFIPPSSIDLFFRLNFLRDNSEKFETRREARKVASKFADTALFEMFLYASNGYLLFPDGAQLSVDRMFLGRVALKRGGTTHELIDLETGRVGVSSPAHRSAWGPGWFFPFSFGLASSIILAMFVKFAMQSYPGEVSYIYLRSIFILFIAGTFLCWLFALSCFKMAKSQSRKMVKRTCYGLEHGRFVFSYMDFVDFVNERYPQYSLNKDQPLTDVSADDIMASPESLCTFRIVSAQDALAASGKKLTRANAQAQYGSDVSARGFDRAWSDAARLRPELSLGGRPQKEPPTR